jgi:hypothetical protein
MHVQERLIYKQDIDHHLQKIPLKIIHGYLLILVKMSLATSATCSKDVSVHFEHKIHIKSNIKINTV